MSAEFRQIKPILEKTNAIDSVIRFITVDDLTLFEHSIWALTNIIGEGDGLIVREKLIKLGVVDAVLDKMLNTERSNKHVIRTVTWFFANIMKGPPFPDKSYLP